MSNVLIARGGRTVGPYTPEEIRRYLAKGSVAPHTPAWTDGLLDWAPLEQVLPSAEAQRGADHPEFTHIAGRSIMPDEVRGFSWGAFLCGPVWGFSYRLWVSILSWLPGIGVLVWFWMGFHGREIAWRARDWESPQAFLESERRWTNAGWAIFAVFILAMAALLWSQRQRLAANPLAPSAPTSQPAPAEPDTPAPPQGRPRAQPQPAEAEPPRPTAQPATRLLARAVWRKELMGMSAERVLALLGEPLHTEKLPDKNVDVWIYRRMSFERDASEPDAFMLIGIQKGVVAGVEFVKKEGQ